MSSLEIDEAQRQSRWDARFLDMAKLVAGWSKDPSTQTGAVIVRPDRTVASLGYNGFPRRMMDYPERYVNREEKYERIVHCEMNAVLNAHGPVNGCTLYTWPLMSCKRCAVHMAQAGIWRCVAPLLKPGTDRYERWQPQLDIAKRWLEECGVFVSLVEYD
jgi:dCMP deaminase